MAAATVKFGNPPDALLGRRKERRLPMSIGVEVCGFDRFGQFFSERTKTANISEGGCQVKLKAMPDRRTALAIRVLEETPAEAMQKKALLYWVTWVQQGERGCTIGSSKLQAGDLW